jgi:hypothetical protein
MTQGQKDQLRFYVWRILKEGMNDELKEMKKSEWFREGVEDIIPNPNVDEIIDYIERFEWDVHIGLPSITKKHNHWD